MDSALNGWHRIEALPPRAIQQRSPRLSALAKQWAAEREVLRSQGEEARLIDKMKNRMAVETGIIEGLYDLSRGITETLIAEGFSASLLTHAETNRDPQLVIAILRDQREAIDAVFEIVKRQRPLSTSVIRELHSLLTRHQPTTTAMDQFGNLHEVQLLRGAWKTAPNNPTRPDGSVHAYSPPEQVGSEMDRLITLHDQYEAIGVAPEVLSAWLHHRFTQIHPFQDGNGRVARLIASIVFIRASWQPLMVLRDDRPDYINALEKADSGDLKPLTDLFASWQSRAFVLALGASRAAEQELTPQLEEVLAALRDKLSAEQAPKTNDLEDVAKALNTVAEQACTRIALTIEDSLRPALPDISARVAVNTLENAGGYKGPRIDLAKQGGFFADFTRASRWARIVIRPSRGGSSATLLISSTALGQSVGSLAVTCGLITDDPETHSAQTTQVCEQFFVATVQDLATDSTASELQQRFQEWATNSLIIGLAQWQRGL